MSLVIANKPSLDNTHKKKHVISYAALKNSHTIHSSPQAPIIQLKSICPCDGGCPRCTGTMQPKLTIGQPNDKYEQEADRVVEQVMRTTVGSMQKAVGSNENTIQKQIEEETIQPKPT